VFAVFNNKDGEWQGDERTLTVDLPGKKNNWPIIEIDKVPSGAISVPVQFDDSGIEYEGCMMAGQFAFYGGRYQYPTKIRLVHYYTPAAKLFVDSTLCICQ